VFDFACVAIIKALSICIASFNFAKNEWKLFYQLAQFVVGYSYGSTHNFYRRVITFNFLKFLCDPAMATIRPPFRLGGLWFGVTVYPIGTTCIRLPSKSPSQWLFVALA
jgi:hypothetical protein